jgi:hypothetical protein
MPPPVRCTTCTGMPQSVGFVAHSKLHQNVGRSVRIEQRLYDRLAHPEERAFPTQERPLTDQKRRGSLNGDQRRVVRLVTIEGSLRRAVP